MSRPTSRELGPRARLDLHMHSDRSDGRFPPAEVLRRCAAGRLDVVALTDHDLPPALPAGPTRIGDWTLHIVHGVELSGTHEGRELHLLVYFPEEMPADYAAFCTTQAAARATRYDEAAARLALEGIPVADDAAHRGERALTRYHLAAALVSAGHAATVGDAFRRWLGDGGTLVPPIELAFTDAIALSRAAGGFTAWAHPSPEQLAALAETLAAAGLHAVEVHRPRLGRHTRDAMARRAWRNGLSVTGGSDWHGWGQGELGAFSVPLRESRDFARAVGLAS